MDDSNDDVWRLCPTRVLPIPGYIDVSETKGRSSKNRCCHPHKNKTIHKVRESNLVI